MHRVCVTSRLPDYGVKLLIGNGNIEGLEHAGQYLYIIYQTRTAPEHSLQQIITPLLRLMCGRQQNILSLIRAHLLVDTQVKPAGTTNPLAVNKISLGGSYSPCCAVRQTSMPVYCVLIML